MNEMTTVYQFFAGLIGLAIACFLYMLGGRSGKWKRRFVASFILAATLNGLTAVRGIWNPLLLATWPLLILGFSLGYGADSFGGKILRRSIYALGGILSGFLFAFIFGGNAWWLLGLHGFLSLGSIYLGVKNPVEASAEEGLICLLLNACLISYPFII